MQIHGPPPVAASVSHDHLHPLWPTRQDQSERRSTPAVDHRGNGPATESLDSRSSSLREAVRRRSRTTPVSPRKRRVGDEVARLVLLLTEGGGPATQSHHTRLHLQAAVRRRSRSNPVPTRRWSRSGDRVARQPSPPVSGGRAWRRKKIRKETKDEGMCEEAKRDRDVVGRADDGARSAPAGAREAVAVSWSSAKSVDTFIGTWLCFASIKKSHVRAETETHSRHVNDSQSRAAYLSSNGSRTRRLYLRVGWPSLRKGHPEATNLGRRRPASRPMPLVGAPRFPCAIIGAQM